VPKLLYLCNLKEKFLKMITIEQLKDVKERTAALERYLDIENKLVQVEEEQLRTQAPGFWDDAKKAEAQMKKVKEIQKWIDGYREVKTLSDELELSFDFFKDDLVTEEEVDVAYSKALTAVESLELKNMLRQEADHGLCAENQFGSRWYGKSGLGIHVDAYVYALGRNKRL